MTLRIWRYWEKILLATHKNRQLCNEADDFALVEI